MSIRAVYKWPFKFLVEIKFNSSHITIIDQTKITIPVLVANANPFTAPVGHRRLLRNKILGLQQNPRTRARIQMTNAIFSS